MFTIYSFISSQNSNQDDGWNGFEGFDNTKSSSNNDYTDFEASYNNTPSTNVAKSSKSMKVATKPVTEPDLLNLDVKASVPKSKANKKEEDIWEILNN